MQKYFDTTGTLRSDALVKASSGYIHTVTFSMNDAAPTAGTIDIYDNTSGSGKKVFSWTMTTAVFTPFTVHLDCIMHNGIYIDFTTTNDINVTISYA